MKKFYIPLLGFLAIPLALLGYILLAYSRNRRRASRFYDSFGRPRDDGTLAYLKQKGIHFVALSARDTCDWSLHAFEEAFGDKYHPLKVGEQLTIKEKSYAQQINS